MIDDALIGVAFIFSYLLRSNFFLLVPDDAVSFFFSSIQSSPNHVPLILAFGTKADQ